MDDLARLQLDFAAAFRTGPDGRIDGAAAHPAGPWADSPPATAHAGPRLYVAGCRAGNLVRLGAGVDEGLADALQRAADTKSPWYDADAWPDWLDAALTRLAPARLTGPEVVFHLPNGLRADAEASIVRCDAPEGRALIERLARDGLPPALVEAGFVGLDDFWWPWCAAMAEGEIAALAFATRLAEASAEIGVFTFPAFRGRGLAAAVTAGWSSLAPLEGRTLIYATRADNAASRKVAARLGLRAIGARLWID